jgi:hypothetical protein
MTGCPQTFGVWCRANNSFKILKILNVLGTDIMPSGSIKCKEFLY